MKPKARKANINGFLFNYLNQSVGMIGDFVLFRLEKNKDGFFNEAVILDGLKVPFDVDKKLIKEIQHKENHFLMPYLGKCEFERSGHPAFITLSSGEVGSFRIAHIHTHKSTSSAGWYTYRKSDFSLVVNNNFKVLDTRNILDYGTSVNELEIAYVPTERKIVAKKNCGRDLKRIYLEY